MKYGPYSSSRLDSATCGYLFYHTYVNPKKERGKVRTLPQDRGSQGVLKKIGKKSRCQTNIL